MSFFKKSHRVAMVLLFVGLACGRIRAQNTPVADISAGYSFFYVVKGFTLATNGGEVTLRRLLEALTARTRLYSAPAGRRYWARQCRKIRAASATGLFRFPRERQHDE